MTCAVILNVCSRVSAYDFNNLEAPFRRALESGNFGGALGLAFLAGVATSLTPCVYPMIAITVSVFGARQARSRMHGAGLSTAFIAGMATLFTPLGIVATLTGGVFGAALASPVVLVVLAVIFVSLALSMFGAFELALPPSWQNKLAHVGGAGPRGAFALGLVSAFIAAPCTGPVLAFLLAWVGTTQNLIFGSLSLFVYSLGLGLLFWIVGTFSISLPKSGRWLEWIKSIFGIVMLVAALYYVRDLIPGFADLFQRSNTLLFLSLAAIAVGMVIGAVYLSYHTAFWGTRIRKTVGVIFVVAGCMGLIGYVQSLPQGARIRWQYNYQIARANALKEKKPFLVDFGASWCGACKELDIYTFSDSRVVAESKRFVAVHVDLSPGKDTPENRTALQSYNQKGLPLVVLHDSVGREHYRITRFVNAAEMLQLMRATD